MKKAMSLLTALFVLFIINIQPSYSQVGFGIFGGLSTPNDEINNVYNQDEYQGVVKFLRDGSKTGYHIGAKIRLPIVDGLMLNGGIAWNRFPESNIDVQLQTEDKTVTLTSIQDIIPITVGINYYVIRTGIGLYATGELAYNYNKNTVNWGNDITAIPLNLDATPTYSRVGAGFGVGLDINAFFLLANLEAKYNLSNVIGRETGEELKSYFTLSLGIYLGSAAAK